MLGHSATPDQRADVIKYWTHEAYLKAPNAGKYDTFGNSIAITGDTVVVGAFAEDSNQTTITNGTTASSDNSATNAGAANVIRYL